MQEGIYGPRAFIASLNFHLYLLVIICINVLYRYLCEYIYFKSLSINKNQTIFIHVPQLDQDNTAQKLAEKLKCVIKKLLEQVTK